jgi:hypothetical protein
MRGGRYLYVGALVVALAIAFGLWNPIDQARADRQGSSAPPKFKVDPFWPKPLPNPGGHQWVTGEVGGSCVDSHDHIITVNRGFQTGGLVGQDGDTSIPSPPVVEYDPEGNVVNAWGNPAKNPDGTNAVLPNGIHGCFVDYQDNVWIAGNGDGVVQKWTHDGSTMLLQIGTKGKCDWPANHNACGNSAGDPAANQSHTLLNDPADMAVDPNPDPVTSERGSVYIADGYGNHRVVVFDAAGHFLRQWGSPGSGPGQFTIGDGGHPHCVVLGKDGLVYACDRGQNRIQVFNKMGMLERIIPIDPPSPTLILSTNRACDIDFSEDRGQAFIYDTDLGSDTVWILDRALGAIVSSLGRAGHNAGEFAFAHTATVDSRGNLYIAETITGRRIQKFVKQEDDN